MAEFVHLHNHSEYSLLDGTTRFTDEKGKPSEFLKTMAAQKVPALAVTDHGNLYGAIEFYESCREVGLKPIIGCETYLAKGSRLDRTGTRKDNCHLTLLAKDYEGYQNLLTLVSKAFLEGFYHDPRIDKKILAEHSRGLIALSGCLKSESSQTILTGNMGEAAKILEEY
ncbi:MAG: PHP domain-containing protein, partial [Elusimicrobia bacterium]|nr:PHP domain-containing protein [Elusimicrobiota bacterium]